MSVRLGPETLVSAREEEFVKWEKRLEEYCEAREEAIQILKSSGEVDLKVHTDSLSPKTNILTIDSSKLLKTFSSQIIRYPMVHNLLAFSF